MNVDVNVVFCAAGLGIFTGINLAPNEPIVEQDIVIPLEDWSWHAGDDTDYHFLWADYSWNIAEVGMNYDLVDGSALVIGTGCMPNCNFALINALRCSFFMCDVVCICI